MPFDRGPISFTICQLQNEMPEDILEKFNAKKGYSLETVLDEPQIGWVSGRHLLETRIDDETAYSGGYLHLNLRSAVRKIPPSLFQAECRIDELALMKEMTTQYLSRKQKKEIQNEVKERLLEKMPPVLTGIPFVIDPASNLLFVGTATASQVNQFLAFFVETIGFEPIPLGPELAVASLSKVDLESLVPLRCTTLPVEKSDGEIIVGRDFATWLWFFQENEGGTFSVEDLGSFSLMVEGPLVFSGEGIAAQEITVKKGLPTISAEAQSALLTGKKLRQAKFLLARDEELWTFTLDADKFAFRSMTLPAIEPLEPHSHFQERIRYLTIFKQVFFHLFENFVNLVSEQEKHEKLTAEIQSWVTHLRPTITGQENDQENE